MKTYVTKGVCPKKLEFEIEDNILKNVRFTGGCDGNLQALAILVEGMPVNDVIRRLKGITCSGKPTSCSDQLARALEENK